MSSHTGDQTDREVANVISQLPAETLQHIFKYCQSFDFVDLEDSNHPPTIAPRSRTMIMTLAMVCRLWRDHVDSNQDFFAYMSALQLTEDIRGLYCERVQNSNRSLTLAFDGATFGEEGQTIVFDAASPLSDDDVLAQTGEMIFRQAGDAYHSLEERLGGFAMSDDDEDSHSSAQSTSTTDVRNLLPNLKALHFHDDMTRLLHASSSVFQAALTTLVLKEVSIAADEDPNVGVVSQVCSVNPMLSILAKLRGSLESLSIIRPVHLLQPLDATAVPQPYTIFSATPAAPVVSLPHLRSFHLAEKDPLALALVESITLVPGVALHLALIPLAHGETILDAQSFADTRNGRLNAIMHARYPPATTQNLAPQVSFAVRRAKDINPGNSGLLSALNGTLRLLSPTVGLPGVTSLEIVGTAAPNQGQDMPSATQMLASAMPLRLATELYLGKHHDGVNVPRLISDMPAVTCLTLRFAWIPTLPDVLIQNGDKASPNLNIVKVIFDRTEEAAQADWANVLSHLKAVAAVYQDVSWNIVTLTGPASFPGREEVLDRIRA